MVRSREREREKKTIYCYYHANTTIVWCFFLSTHSRKAHGVGFALFTDHEHDGQVEQTLEAMSHPTIAHLAWRFRKWYENKRLLAAIAAPLLREMVDRMVQTPALKQGDKRPFVIYSCHDIVSTVLYSCCVINNG